MADEPEDPQAEQDLTSQVSRPLITRPSYGVVGEAKLPVGDPAGKGVSLDPEIPGTSTYAKPSGESPREQGTDDESMYRVDNADDLLKDQSKSDQIDHSRGGPTMVRPGPDETSKTKYPYRDGIPNAHNASIIWDVVQNWLAETGPEVTANFDLPVKVAKRIGDVEEGLSDKVQERSKTCSVTVKRVDVANLRWLFSVDCGNGPKTVKMKASRKGRVTDLSKMDVKFTCSCHAWRWLGSEHHSKQEEYLDGKPRGTATVPVIKDPLNVNRVCKHVAAVFGTVRTWKVPLK